MIRKTLPILLLVLILTGVNLYAKDQTVWLSYYGTTDFDVQPATVHIEAGDVIHYQTDGPGTLILRLDNGTVYHSDSGEITLTSDQLGATKLVRCSMILEDGTFVGWEVSHDSRMGHDIDCCAARLSPSQTLLTVLIALGLL